MVLDTSYSNKPSRTNAIIPVIWDRDRSMYVIEVAESLFGEVQKTLIDGGKERNIGIFFTVEEKRMSVNESITEAVKKAQEVM